MDNIKTFNTFEADNQYFTVSGKLVDNTIINSPMMDCLQYLPDFMQDKDVMQDAAYLLNAILQNQSDVDLEIDKINSEKGTSLPRLDWSTIDNINKAYCDIIYKSSGYNKLSYEAKIEFLKEQGFDYMLDLLLHMYDNGYKAQKEQTYEEYVKQRAESSLSKLTMLFNILYILKGKTIGLELALKICGMNDFTYFTWDTVSKYKGGIIFEPGVTIHDEDQFGMPVEYTDNSKGTLYYIQLNDPNLEVRYWLEQGTIIKQEIVSLDYVTNL